MHIFFQEQQHRHPSFFRRYLQLNFLREQSATDLPIIMVNDNENVICDTNGPEEKICYFQGLMPEANPVLSINVIRVYIGGVVAWWLTPRRSGVRALLGSPSCVLEQEMFNPYSLKHWLYPGSGGSIPTLLKNCRFTGTLSIKPNQSKTSLYMTFNNIVVSILVNSTLLVYFHFRLQN